MNTDKCRVVAVDYVYTEPFEGKYKIEFHQIPEDIINNEVTCFVYEKIEEAQT